MIFYSLGNFIFSSAFKKLAPIPNDPRLWESFIVSLEIKKDHSYTTKIHGYQTSDYGVRMYGITENARLEADIQEVSHILLHRWLSYWKAYYVLCRDICNKNKKVKKELQQIQTRPFMERWKIYLSFNSQDFRNRLACHVPWLFK